MNIIKLDSINSTNTYSNFLLQDGKCELPFVVTARNQYAGRGRLGKSFYSPADTGLYLSYTFKANYPDDVLLKTTVITASIIHKILSSYCDNLSIKWINDIYRGNRKIAGILTERVDMPNMKNDYYIIIGIGINVFPNSIPEELENLIGFLFDEPNESDIISEIGNKISSELNEVFGNSSNEYFDELIKYYSSHCSNLPNRFANELLDL